MDPISAKERVQLLDVLRGFAIFGMFTVNMTADLLWGESFREIDLPTPDLLALIFVDFFTNGKFITIFSFLFGIGFFVQMERAGQRGGSQTLFYLRRSLGLLLIGVGAMSMHLLSWILIDYAIFGLALLLFYKRSSRVILIAVVSCFVVAKIFGSIIPDVREHTELQVLAAEQGVSVAEVVQPADPVDEARETAFREGSFGEISAALLGNAWESFSDFHYYLGELDLLALLLLGLYAGQRGAVWDADARRSIARKTLPWLLTIGLSGMLISGAMLHFDVGEKGSLSHTITWKLAAWPFGMPMLGLGYAAAITLLIERETWEKILTPFAAVGRMALTNYLFTNLVIAIVSFPWALGLYDKLMPLTGLIIVVLVYPFQVFASRWWLRRFQFGPVEYLWRAFTYGHLPPMRQQAANALE